MEEMIKPGVRKIVMPMLLVPELLEDSLNLNRVVLIIWNLVNATDGDL